MSKKKIKVGDKVRIVSDKSEHGFPIGMKINVCGTCNNAPKFFISDGVDHKWIVKSDIEPIKKKSKKKKIKNLKKQVKSLSQFIEVMCTQHTKEVIDCGKQEANFEKDLVSFGNYMVSEEREVGLRLQYELHEFDLRKDNHVKININMELFDEALRTVSDADIENWKLKNK